MAGTPSIGVLALQGDVREHLRALREAGCQGTAIRRPSELDAVDGLVIPGGESTTIWKLATAFELMQPLRKRIAAGMPAFGSCGPRLHAVFIRAPWVERVGTSVEVLSRHGGTDRIVAVRQGPLLATAFHPELTADIRIHRLFADIVKGTQ